ncbi:response regulator transcription factor [Nocardioides albidus]|uniref:Response regulator transcription factor n=1 Tax=Nocardioides albidus TaxID=1517589 RepID=A0A5C4VL28_9ACTN|nr:response regulator transcription factor [Nocardioides albidus]TNM36461.1 response regulator transcription factor [Nocardioides albidus]
MTRTAASALLADGIAATGVDELSLPHIVITVDVPTSVVTYSGPYANALEASAAAEAARCRQMTQDPGWEVTFSVAPLCGPADDGHRVDRPAERCDSGPAAPQHETGASRGARVSVYLLISEHGLDRGISDIVATDPEIRIAGHADSAPRAVREIERLRPQVVLVSGRFADGSVVQACRDIRAIDPAIRTLVLAGDGDSDLISTAHVAEVGGIVLNDLSGRSLLPAIKFVGSGHMLLDSTVARRLFDQWVARRRVPDGLSAMTQQQSKVFLLLASGMSNKEIADRLCLAEKTVMNHVTGVLTCLGVDSRAQAALIGHSMGIGA